MKKVFTLHRKSNSYNIMRSVCFDQKLHKKNQAKEQSYKKNSIFALVKVGNNFLN